MKKICLTIILVGLFLLAGCANDQYSVEQQYWYTKKSAEKVFKNPAGSPPAEMEKAVAGFKKFINRYPKNILALDADFKIASLYLVKQEFEKARQHLDSMMGRYNNNPEINSQVLFMKGSSYQMENKWPSALEQYKKIIADFPLTKRGLETPIFIAQYYKNKFEPEKMRAAFDEAIAHYTGLAAKYPDSVAAFKSYTFISSCYSAMKNWPQAVKTLDAMVEKYTGKLKMDAVLMDIALIYKRELKDDAKAKEVLARLIKEYPKSKFASAAKSFLEKP